MISLPESVKRAFAMLESAGFSCHLVGGCVRDALLGQIPADFDLTTNARPAQLKAVFAGVPCFETGLAHGTLTVVMDDLPMEITTYRIDGDYEDARHPSRVTFTDRLVEDLARRDFTVNAMAWHPDTGLIDCFGGQDDLNAGILRCVGDPATRFSEDALRILRCLRFASVLGFFIAPETASALHSHRVLLRRISAERIREECNRLLMGEHVTSVLLDYPDVLGVPLPELLPGVGFDQHSPYHKYTVWDHTAYAVGAAVASLPVRLTMLLHDFGKPAAFTQDSSGRGHFKGHAVISAAMAGPILARLRYDKHTAARITTLVAHHDDKLREPRQIRRALAVLGEEAFFQLVAVRRADISAKQEFCLAELADADQAETVARQLLAERACLSLRDLCLDGNDLLQLGVRGRRIGAILDNLLLLVLDGSLTNERDVLLAEARRQAATEF